MKENEESRAKNCDLETSLSNEKSHIIAHICVYIYIYKTWHPA